MANYSLGKISKQPFPPTIFYDTLKAIIYTFHSTFLSEMVTVWKVATSIIKWYFRLGVSSRIKMWFARKAKQNWKYLQKLQTGLVQGGQGTRISVLGSWWIILHRYKNLSNFPEKKYILFSFGVCFPKTVSYRPKHARKCLISNVIMNNFFMVIKLLSNI